MNIEQVELEVSRNLQTSLKSALQQVGYSVPDTCRVCVSLVDANGRKKRSNAKADNWSPDSGRLQVWFELGNAVHAAADGEAVQPRSAGTLLNGSAPQTIGEQTTSDDEPGLAVVVRVLAHAENTPGWSFVSLKKFRDEILPAEASGLSPIDQRHFLGYAISERLIMTNRVANPKDPRFPVTTIRLNRLNIAVQKILGERARKSLGFAPIQIKGEPLSATILRERR